MPTRISHSALPGFTRSASVCGSRRSAWSEATASAISLGVRRRMKTGLPCHLMVISWPRTTLEMSCSIEAMARTSDEGLIWSITGQPMAATAPTAPAAAAT